MSGVGPLRLGQGAGAEAGSEMFDACVGHGVAPGIETIPPLWARLSHIKMSSLSIVMLNSFQHPFLVTNGGFSGTMDPEINSG